MAAYGKIKCGLMSTSTQMASKRLFIVNTASKIVLAT